MLCLAPLKILHSQVHAHMHHKGIYPYMRTSKTYNKELINKLENINQIRLLLEEGKTSSLNGFLGWK